jgi:hypothetical protein
MFLSVESEATVSISRGTCLFGAMYRRSTPQKVRLRPMNARIDEEENAEKARDTAPRAIIVEIRKQVDVILTMYVPFCLLLRVLNITMSPH